MVTRRIVLAGAAAAALAGAVVPSAHAAGRLVDVQIVDRQRDDVLPQHWHRGRAWVAGRPGDRYAVRLSNRSGGRVLVVLSVDGINAVTGQTAAYAQTGYVLGPWQSAEITGWRKSDAEAAAFYFTSLPDSYAARTDRPGHVGVIGAAVFRERQPWPRPRPWEPVPYPGARRDGASRGDGEPAAREGRDGEAAAPPAAADAATAQGARRQRDALPSRAEKLGTGHGEREYSPVEHTAFERASAAPAEVVQVRYDSYRNLVAAGVLGPRGGPEAFPGYVPDPRY